MSACVVDNLCKDIDLLLEKNYDEGKNMSTFDTIDAYIRAQDPQIQALLQSVRTTIHSAEAELEERMSWQMPTFWHKENVIHFCAFKHHFSLFAGADAVETFAHRLEGLKTSKGTIQIPYGVPVDHELIADIVKWRMQTIRAGGKRERPAARGREAMPADIRELLDQQQLFEAYEERPPYQKNDYLRWILSAKKEETRQKRLHQMLEELREGDVYMGRAYVKKKRRNP